MVLPVAPTSILLRYPSRKEGPPMDGLSKAKTPIFHLPRPCDSDLPNGNLPSYLSALHSVAEEKDPKSPRHLHGSCLVPRIRGDRIQELRIHALRRLRDFRLFEEKSLPRPPAGCSLPVRTLAPHNLWYTIGLDLSVGFVHIERSSLPKDPKHLRLYSVPFCNQRLRFASQLDLYLVLTARHRN